MPSLNRDDNDQICKILCELITGSDITRMLQTFNFPIGDPSQTKWRRLSEIISYQCALKISLRPVFDTIEYICKPSKYIDSPEKWSDLKRDINKVLIFKGFELNDAGKIQELSEKITTFSDARRRLQTLQDRIQDLPIHEQTLKYCSEEYLKENYFHAILEASKGIFQRIREMTGSSKDSASLIDECFQIKSPIVYIKENRLQTQDELSEYKGLKNLLLTIAHLYRNSHAHRLRYYNPDSLDDTITALVTMSLAHDFLDRCTNSRRLD